MITDSIWSEDKRQKVMNKLSIEFRRKGVARSMTDWLSMTDFFRGMASCAVGAWIGWAGIAGYQEKYQHAIYALILAVLATWLRAVLGPMDN